LITEAEATAAEEMERKDPAPSKSVAAAASARAAPEPQPATAAMPALDIDGGRQVVAVPARKRYHRPECRFAASKGAQTVSLAAAQRRGYDACGVCKP
jgi:hypothetical protein